MSEEKKTLPSDVLDEVKTSEQTQKDVSEVAAKLEGKIPTKPKEE